MSLLSECTKILDFGIRLARLAAAQRKSGTPLRICRFLLGTLELVPLAGTKPEM
jgi:hypothetical protein